MSSETSTDHSDSLQPWQLFTLAGLLGATLVVFISKGHTAAGVVLLSLTIFAAAGVGLAAWRTFSPFSMRFLPTAMPILGGRTRAALERDKALVLRSLKELEFDRAMGKVSEKDFVEMTTRLRARATRIIRQLDAGTGYRSQIEQELERRLGPAPVRAAARACAQCGHAADVDAQFCKHCGSALAGPHAGQTSSQPGSPA